MQVKAYCLLSGGLDSVLTIKLLQEQNINTVALYFKSAFFDKTSTIVSLAQELNIELILIDITQEHFQLVQNPQYGYGKNLNPCIDCHTLMLKKAASLLNLNQKEFVATGEVLNQRPMSQNKSSLLRIAQYSGLNNLLLRPLSAKLLPPTLPEEKGWVNREKLLSIYGKSRKIQLDLAQKWNLKNFETPAGGCRLTDKTFASRLIYLKNQGLFNNQDLIYATNFGRIFEITPQKIVIVSRNQEEGEKLKALKDKAQLLALGEKTIGPTLLGFGDFLPKEKQLVGQFFSYYSKVKGKEQAFLTINNENFTILPLNLDEFNALIEKIRVV